jgi:hypothetical protein
VADPHVDLSRSPNLFWPGRTGLVRSTAAFIDPLLNEPHARCWPLNPDHSLAFDTDDINPVA